MTAARMNPEAPGLKSIRDDSPAREQVGAALEAIRGALDPAALIGVSIGARSHGAGEDLLDGVGLGVGVVLHMTPAAGGQLPLRPFVEDPIVGMPPQPIAEGDEAVDLGRAGREDVQVEVGSRPLSTRCSCQSGSRMRSR